MRKSAIVIAALAAAISTAAVAAEKKSPVPATATQMSDSEMDKVTAGAGAGVLQTGNYSGNAPVPFTPDSRPIEFQAGLGTGTAAAAKP